MRLADAKDFSARWRKNEKLNHSGSGAECMMLFEIEGHQRPAPGMHDRAIPLIYGE
jgi:hypothetical protein